MRSIPAALHKVLDFVTVAAFLLAPTVLRLTGFAATLAYVLAAVHLSMTLLTRFAPAGRHPVPLGLHGVVESIVGIALLALPWLLKWSGTPRVFYTAAGIVILAVWALSQYRAPAPRAAA